MSIQFSSVVRALKRQRLTTLVIAMSLAFFSACSDGDLFTPNARGPARVALQPYFESVTAMSLAADINLIRVTVKRLPSGEIVSQEDFPVDPAASEWNLDLEVPQNSDLELLIVGISRTLTGVETIEFSGVLQVSVTTGEQPSPAPVPVFPGPPENLSVTSVAISPRPQTLLEGDQVQLTATPSGGPASPTIIWASTNSSVATVSASGNVTALAPGQTVIAAFVGRASDNISITVTAKAASIAITPANPTIATIGGTITLTGRVLDARNTEVPGLAVTWSIADPTVAVQVSPGVFSGLRNGETIVTASTTQAGRTITATTTLKVEQRATSISLHPASLTFETIGTTQSLAVTLRDASGAVVAGGPFTWTSANEAVATVDANGNVTARGVGDTKITVSGAGLTAEADVRVERSAAAVFISPGQATLRNYGETVQLRAEVRDAQGLVIPNMAVEWESARPAAASVTSDGIVTAFGNGDVIITATAGSATGSATIHIERVPAEIELNQTSIELEEDETFQLEGTVFDEAGFPIVGEEITWSSSDPEVASVNAVTGLVTAHSNGEAQITAAAGEATAHAFVTVGEEVPPGEYKVLVVSNSSGDNASVVTGLQTRMPTVTVVSTTNPADLTPFYLSQFQVVLLYENGLWPSAAAVGNAIAEYLLSGGNVIIGTFYWQDRSDNLIYHQGGWGNLELYDPFFGPHGSEYNNDQLDVESIVTHPLTAGVNSLIVGGGGYHGGVAAKEGTSVVARWSDGVPFIGYRTFENHSRFVGISIFPAHEAHGGITGDFWRVWTNAVSWAATGGTPFQGDNVVNLRTAPFDTRSTQAGPRRGGTSGIRK